MNTHRKTQHQSQSEDRQTGQDQAQNPAGNPQMPDEQDSPMENPAAQSEIGAQIYDIGMGGPGASSSGLRTGEDEEE